MSTPLGHFGYDSADWDFLSLVAQERGAERSLAYYTKRLEEKPDNMVTRLLSSEASREQCRRQLVHIRAQLAASRMVFAIHGRKPPDYDYYISHWKAPDDTRQATQTTAGEAGPTHPE